MLRTKRRKPKWLACRLLRRVRRVKRQKNKNEKLREFGGKKNTDEQTRTGDGDGRTETTPNTVDATTVAPAPVTVGYKNRWKRKKNQTRRLFYFLFQISSPKRSRSVRAVRR